VARLPPHLGSESSQHPLRRPRAAQLAAEADIKRWVLTPRHLDLKVEFERRRTHANGVRRAMRPSEDYREPTDVEWAEFQQRFHLRKLELGDCGRPTAHRAPTSTSAAPRCGLTLARGDASLRSSAT
jgi:hypothetical protein